MKTLLLIFLLSVCALVMEGCSSSGAGAANAATGGVGGNATGGAGNGAGTGGGSAGAGSGGRASGGSAGAGSVCPGARQVSGNECRSPKDCPGGGNNGYYCTDDPASVLSACATPFCVTPPTHACTVDSDCPAADHCITVLIKCCLLTSTVCELSCKTGGFTCAAGTTCSPGTPGADRYDCVPVLCNAGYTCPTGFVCAVGANWVDEHGCQALPCSQTGCPANFVCTPTATIGGCIPKPCSTDCDCDLGFCVDEICVSTLGTCARPPS